MTTDKQAENLRVAYSIMEGIPATKINLSTWRGIPKDGRLHACISENSLLHKCNTVGCVGGYLAVHPYFKAQGLSTNGMGTPVLLEGSPWDASRKLFGNCDIFQAGSSGIEGKREALARIREALFRAGKITPKRNRDLRLIEMAGRS